MAFTLFVILPNEDVCSLRNLHSGISVKTVRKQLELAAGLPAQTYRLTCSQGQLMHEDHVLILDANVWDGFIMRAHLLDSWQELYDHIVANDIDDIIQHGAVYMRRGNLVIEGEDEARVKDLVTERGVVALFLSSFLGMVDMCKALLSVGINPNGKTPFGRTPLFAALSRDNDHVMELLLSYHASLESRDLDGVTCVEVGRRLVTKQCMRKIRHLQLQGRAGENGSAMGVRSADTAGHVRRGLSSKIIRVPSGASDTTTIRDSSTPLPSRPSTVKLFRESLFSQASSAVPSGVVAQRNRADLRLQNGHSPDLSSKVPSLARKFKQGQGQGQSQGEQSRGEQYTWENSANNVARTVSTAGTQVRIQTPAESGMMQLSSGGGGQLSRLGQSYGVSWSDSVSVTSAHSPRMLSFRPKVHDITVPAPSAVSVITSSFTTALRSLEKGREADSRAGSSTLRRPSALYKYYVEPGHHHSTMPNLHHSQMPSYNFQFPMSGHPQAHDNHQAEVSYHNQSHDNYHQVDGYRKTDGDAYPEPHYPAQEPPERPPSRHETHSQYFTASDIKGDHHPLGRLARDNSLTGSQDALSIGSAPELQTSTGLETKRSGQGVISHPDSDDDGGRVQTSRGTASRSSGRARSRLLVSRQKQVESWRTMKRRIKIAEEQKRSTAKPKSRQKAKEPKETFEEWLERKRNEESGHARNGSGSSDEDSEDSESDDRSVENTHAFNDWLRELKERPLTRPQTATPASLHRRKSRPLRDLIQVGAVADPKANPAAYISAFREWQQGNAQASQPPLSPGDIKETKRRVEEKRKQLLAMALTYEDWLDHAEERKQLVAAILRADTAQLTSIEQQILARRAPRNISFNQWREKVGKREGEIRQQRQRMRKEADLRQENTNEFRSSAAIAHEEWVRKKKEEAFKARRKGGKGREPDKADAARAEDDKQVAWEAWLERKHRREVTQLDSHLKKERQQLLNLRQKKQPTVTPC